jgi:hypothetical protein
LQEPRATTAFNDKYVFTRDKPTAMQQRIFELLAARQTVNKLPRVPLHRSVYQ